MIPKQPASGAHTEFPRIVHLHIFGCSFLQRLELVCSQNHRMAKLSVGYEVVERVGEHDDHGGLATESQNHRMAEVGRDL